MYPNTYFQKAVGGVKSSSGVIREDQIKLCFKQFSLHGKISSLSLIILGSNQFYLWQQGFGIVLFSENNFYTGPSRIRLSVVVLYFWASWQIVQRLLQINAKLNRQGGHSFTAKTDTFLSQEEVGGFNGIKPPLNSARTGISAFKSFIHSCHAVVWSMSKTQNIDISIQ